MDYSTLAVKINTGSFSFEDMRSLAKTSTNIHALRVLSSMDPLPDEIIEILLNRNERKILISLLQNSGVKLDVLNRYADTYEDEFIFGAVGRNANIDVQLGMKVAKNFNAKLYKALLTNNNMPGEVITLMWEKCLEQEGKDDFRIGNIVSEFREHLNASPVVQMEAHMHPSLKYAPKPKLSLIVEYLKDHYPGISEELPKEWLAELLVPIIEKRFAAENSEVI